MLHPGTQPRDRQGRDQPLADGLAEPRLGPRLKRRIGALHCISTAGASLPPGADGDKHRPGTTPRGRTLELPCAGGTTAAKEAHEGWHCSPNDRHPAITAADHLELGGNVAQVRPSLKSLTQTPAREHGTLQSLPPATLSFSLHLDFLLCLSHTLSHSHSS